MLNGSMLTKEQVIIETWERAGEEVVGAAEIAKIQDAVGERFGVEASPALIARVLADLGARLAHPEVIQTDSRWREQHLFGLFTADELAFGTMESATSLIEKVERLRQQFAGNQSMLGRLRLAVQKLKSELDVLAVSEKSGKNRRELAGEVAQWLTVWLQNPAIFNEWLVLRQTTADFRARFPS